MWNEYNNPRHIRTLNGVVWDFQLKKYSIVVCAEEAEEAEAAEEKESATMKMG